MRAPYALVIFVLATSVAWGGPTEADTEEIKHLLSYLAISDCTFNRNGTWYSALQATDHLRGKYDYLLKKALVSTAESFIDRAASRSSVSGNPYLVRCGNAEPVESAAWLLAELARFRDVKRPTANQSAQPTPVSSPRSSPVAADRQR